MPTTLITGASSGIGQAIARQLLSEGQKVIGVSRTHDAFQDRPDYIPVVCDFKKPGDVEQCLKPVLRCHEIDNLIINAGVGLFGSLEQLSSSDILDTFSINLLSQILVTRLLVPKLKSRPDSRLIFIASEAALSGATSGSIYCASKAALRSFAQSLRFECAKSDTYVSIINPGMVRTPFFDGLHFAPGPADENAVSLEQIVQTVNLILETTGGGLFEEITLRPLKHVVVKS